MSTLPRRFPGMAFGAAVLLSALAAQAAPPPERDVAAWSDEHRKIAAESGARITGDWVTARAPYLKRPMICAGVDHPAPSVWMVASAKVGKTQVPLNAALHCIDTAPRSIGVITPSLAKATDFEREILRPAVDATSKVATKMMATRSRSGEGSTTRFKRFRGGFLKIISGASEKELQQSDIGLMIYEEPSSFMADVGGRGSPLKQGRERQAAWGDDAKEIGTGTPKFVGDCVVTAEVERGTVERYYLPCPDCGHLQQLLWENMTTFGGRPHFVCQNAACGVLIGHEHKLAMLAAADALHPELGGWVPCFRSPDPAHPDDPERENPANPRPPVCFAPDELTRWQGRDTEGRPPSFAGIWQAYSPFTTWSIIWTKWLDVRGKPDEMVAFWQQVLGLPFEPSYERPSSSDLHKANVAAARIAGVERGVIPSWAWATIGAADVQGYGIVWAVYAVGPGPDGTGRRYARIDNGMIAVPTVNAQAWAELGAIVQRSYEGPACRRIGIDRFGVDTGFQSTKAYAFCAGRPNVLALKGAKDRDAVPLNARPIKAKVGGRSAVRMPLFLVGTHKLKKDVYHGLAQMQTMASTGLHPVDSIVLAGDATEEDFKQLTAEALLPKDPAKGRREESWEVQPAGAPNEQLDLAVYAQAMAWAFLPDRMTAEDWEAFAAQRRREPGEAERLPLEQVWAAAAGGQRPTSDAPTAAGSSRDDLPGTGAGTADAGGARAGVEPASAPPANVPTSSTREALLRMARRNRSDDA